MDCFKNIKVNKDDIIIGIICGNFPLECLFTCVQYLLNIDINIFHVKYNFLWNNEMNNKPFENYLLDAIINYDFIHSAGIRCMYKGKLYEPSKQYNIHEGSNTLLMDNILFNIFRMIISSQNSVLLLLNMFNNNEYVNGYPYTMIHRNRFVCLLINGYYECANFLLSQNLIELNYIVLLCIYCADLYNDWSNTNTEIIYKKNNLIRNIRYQIGNVLELSIQNNFMGTHTYLKQNENLQGNSEIDVLCYTIDQDFLDRFFYISPQKYSRKYNDTMARISYVSKYSDKINVNSIFNS